MISGGGASSALKGKRIGSPTGRHVNNVPINTNERQMMNIQSTKISLIFGLLAAIFLFAVEPAIATEVVLVGEVNEEFQIFSNGIIYEVADNEQGNYLVRNFIGTKVKVTGVVAMQGEVKISDAKMP
jgi:hypothetical protein